MNLSSPKSLESLLADLLEVPRTEIHATTGRDTLAAWTSLAHIRIVNTVEDTYGVTLTTSEIVEATTVGRLAAILRAKGVPL